jgi:hypothetical protein
MKFKEFQQYEGRYGLLIWQKDSTDTKMFHGIIKYVTEDVLLFRIKGISTKPVKLSEIISFEEKIMEPEVTEFRGKKVIWDGGILCHPEELRRRNEINLKR